MNYIILASSDRGQGFRRIGSRFTTVNAAVQTAAWWLKNQPWDTDPSYRIVQRTGRRSLRTVATS